MVYTMEGHALKHAVEEMLFHLLPTVQLTYAEAVGEGDWCRSILTEADGQAQAKAIVCLDGMVRESESRAPIEGLQPLDYKRTNTELVNRYRAPDRRARHACHDSPPHRHPQ